MKKLFLLLALLGMVAVGCSKDEGGNIPDDAYISLNKEIVTISPDGESVGVKVYSNYAWELTNNCDWITTSITSGDASDTGVTVTLTADLTYDDRDGTIIFSCGKAKKLLVVSQKLKEVIIPDAENTFNIPVEGGVAVISYQTSVDCEVIIPEETQDWITIAPATRGLSTYSTTLNIAENNSDKERSCVVKVVSKDNNKLSTEYTIVQNPRCYLYYTSSNGEIVQPYDSYAFGATIISNTYIDGVGVIEFKAPIATIGNSAFEDCESLTSVTIPDSVTTIGSSAFESCDSLTSITIPDSVTTIGDYAFYSCDSLTSVTIPDSVTTIGMWAFCDCSSLTSVTIGDSVTTIEGSAFRGCSSLTSVTIPDSVTTIGDSAFRGCSSLTSATIPDSVTTIGDGPFAGCNGLKVFKGKFASEDGRCLIIDGTLNSFAPAGLTECIIPNSVTKIGYEAFYGCHNLTSVTIPDRVTTIGDSAFRGCNSLTSITIPDSVTSIGERAFGWCFSLTSATIGNSVTTIGMYAFSDCDSLTSITIPDSVTSIGDSAFSCCDSLTSVYCKPTTPPVGRYDMFYANASGRKIYVPMESVEAYKSASYWSDYADAIVGYNF